MTCYRYYTATTLDGFLADDSDSLDWLFKQHIDEDGPGNTTAFLSDVGVQIMGSTTYLWVLEHERAWLPESPTVVCTHRDLEPANEPGSFVSGSPAGHRGAIGALAHARGVV